MNASLPPALGAVATLAVLVFTAQATTDESFRRTLTVAPGGTLTVEVDFGAIEVTGAAEDEVILEVSRRVRGKSVAAEKAFLADRPIVVEPDGAQVTIRARRSAKTSWGWGGGMKETTGRYLLQIPAKFDVQLNTVGEHLQVANLTGSVRAGTSGGGLKFVRISGPIQGHTSGGGISLTACQGTLQLETSGGGIDVTGGGGTLQAHTSGGGIRVKNFDGPAKVETSGGDLNLENISGELKGETSGGSVHATLPQLIPGPVRLETSGGDVTVDVPAAAAFDLDAATSGGDCNSELALTRQTSNPKQRNTLRGAMGDGGPKVTLRSSGGGIRVRSRAATR